jgi:hypothetical protein
MSKKRGDAADQGVGTPDFVKQHKLTLTLARYGSNSVFGRAETGL